jgi:hypothetical protein
MGEGKPFQKASVGGLLNSPITSGAIVCSFAVLCFASPCFALLCFALLFASVCGTVCMSFVFVLAILFEVMGVCLLAWLSIDLGWPHC